MKIDRKKLRALYDAAMKGPYALRPTCGNDGVHGEALISRASGNTTFAEFEHIYEGEAAPEAELVCELLNQLPDILDGMSDETFEAALVQLETLCAHVDFEAAHLRGMIQKLREIYAEGRREKAMRWLGFIQGALWIEGVAGLDELKNMNREGAR